MRARTSFVTPLEKCQITSIGKSHDLKQLSSPSGGDDSSGTRVYAPHRRQSP